jgi:signal transduction histidine kinase
VRSTAVVALLVAMLRLGTLVQMVPSVLVAVDVSARPGLCAASWGLAIVSACVTAGGCLVRRRPPGATWSTVDVLVAVTVLLLGILTVPAGLRSGSWVGFQPGYALSVVCSLLLVPRPVVWWGGVVLLVSAQAAYLQPLLTSGPVDVASAVGHLLTLVVLSLVTRVGARALQDVARTADDNRALAVAAGREAEARRGRIAVHNATAVLSLLVALDEPRGARESDARAHLLHQASDELVRMRSYLRADHRTHPGGPGQDGTTTLAAVVDEVARDVVDLDVVVQTDLARAVTLDPAAGADLAAALRSLLLNVRQHAHAGRVVLHAEEVEPAGTWSLSVHDDGVGFDPTRVTWGTGLADVVLGQLARHDIDVVVDSLPGVGTTVTLAGASARLGVREGARGGAGRG